MCPAPGEPASSNELFHEIGPEPNLHIVLLGCLDEVKVVLDQDDPALVIQIERPILYAMRPFDGGAAAHGNGTMICLVAPSRPAVDAFHAAALSAGGTDEEAPGIRKSVHESFYAAYLRDPDRNELSAICETPA